MRLRPTSKLLLLRSACVRRTTPHDLETFSDVCCKDVAVDPVELFLGCGERVIRGAIVCVQESDADLLRDIEQMERLHSTSVLQDTSHPAENLDGRPELQNNQCSRIQQERDGFAVDCPELFTLSYIIRNRSHPFPEQCVWPCILGKDDSGIYLAQLCGKGRLPRRDHSAEQMQDG